MFPKNYVKFKKKPCSIWLIYTPTHVVVRIDETEFGTEFGKRIQWPLQPPNSININ